MTKAWALALLCLAVDPAIAGPNDFAWLTATEVVPDRSVEIESRITDHNDRGPLHERETSWWASPSIGLSSCLELRFPVELTWHSETGSTTDTRLSRFGAEASYRLARSEHAAFSPLLRFGLSRDVKIRNLVHAEIDVAASYDVGDVRFAASAGVTFEANRGGAHFVLRPGAGASVRVKRELRLGAEIYAEQSVDSAAVSWAVVGPTLAWRHGRAWSAATLGVGFEGVWAAGRITWGLAF